MAEIADSLQLIEEMAGTTRLELATSAVTGQRSNQLNYVPAFNARPDDGRRSRGVRNLTLRSAMIGMKMVGSEGLEPSASCL